MLSYVGFLCIRMVYIYTSMSIDTWIYNNIGDTDLVLSY